MTPAHTQADPFDVLLAQIQARFTSIGDQPLFTTDASSLYDVFLAALPAEHRQHYTCRACRRFVDQFGGLVTITDQGDKVPALWASSSNVPELFRSAVHELHQHIAYAEVTGVFLHSEREWGTARNSCSKPPYSWQHLAITVPQSRVFRDALGSASQAMAAKAQDYEILGRALGEFAPDTVARAVELLRGAELYRSEKAQNIAEWFQTIHAGARAERWPDRRKHLLWRVVAMAPAGWCHIRSSMIGTLLEDIEARLPFESIRKRWADKMNPLQYQRPTTLPIGAIDRAEKIMAELGAAGALARRFARVEDLETLWRPVPAAAPAGGVFGHLRKTDKPERIRVMTGTPVTWEKFQRTVLPHALTIEALIPERGPFVALVTAVNPDAPPVLQWDSLEQRNPVSWYHHHPSPAPAGVWNLQPRTYRAVTAVAYHPPMWHDGYERNKHHGRKVVFTIEGARDMRSHSGGGLFPECMRSEFREIRAVIEAHARQAGIEGSEQANACGLSLTEGSSLEVTLLVTTEHAVTLYRLDRWD